MIIVKTFHLYFFLIFDNSDQLNEDQKVVCD
jgi:hypothetical protein